MIFFTPSCFSKKKWAESDLNDLLIFQLVEYEMQYLKSGENPTKLLEKIIDDGSKILDNPEEFPRSRQGFLSAAEAISIYMASYNFIQPSNNLSNSPETIVQSLSPIKLGKDDIKRILTLHENKVREKYFDFKNGDAYYVDCDIGSLIIYSIFNKVGWDVRLVRSSGHMFLRYHMPDGKTVNWDWANFGSFPNQLYYLGEESAVKFQLRRGEYYRSLSKDQIIANFIGLISSSAENYIDAADILFQAIEIDPYNSRNLINLAWIYSTEEVFLPKNSDLAIMYALQAVSADLHKISRLETLACAYAANRQWKIAAEIQKEYIRNSNIEIEENNNYKNIMKKSLCE